MLISKKISITFTVFLSLAVTPLTAVPKAGGPPVASSKATPTNKSQSGNYRPAPEVLIEMIACLSERSLAQCLENSNVVTVQKLNAVVGAQVSNLDFPVGSQVLVNLLSSEGKSIHSVQGIVDFDSKIGTHVIYVLPGKEIHDGVLLIQPIQTAVNTPSSSVDAGSLQSVDEAQPPGPSTYAAVKIDVGGQEGINLGNGLQRSDDSNQAIKINMGSNAANASSRGCSLQPHENASPWSLMNLMAMVFVIFITLRIFSTRKAGTPES